MASPANKRQKILSETSHLASSSSSSSHYPRWIFDVFLSFRGEDVRRNFLSHVRKEFERKGIITFDDNGIERSESISRVLMKAIQESRVAIVVLSKNYASSSWCLNELLEIMRCKEAMGLKVIPVFYEVDPSHVRKQKGDFGSVFETTCEGKSEEEKQRWSRALSEVAGLAGEHSQNWDGEADMILKIATLVSNVLNFTPTRDFDDLVGMETHIDATMELLCLESDEVRFVGIWGPAGIGKTTIARALFHAISGRFRLSCFIDNVKGNYERSHKNASQVHLQERLSSKIFDQKGIKVQNLRAVPARLKDQNVLLVLDDVDDLNQLEALAETTHWFGPRSRVIVATENKHLLVAHKINHIYKVKFPSAHEALEIVCKHSFGQSFPRDGFFDSAMTVAELAGHLPLGLEVLGSSLRGRNKDEWAAELRRMKRSIHGDIADVLKVGFDRLPRDEDRSIFLHIACLFNGETKDNVTIWLANSGLEIDLGLKVLAERSLVHIDTSGRIRMHNLLEQLGKRIILRRSNVPGKREFLWNAEDIDDVLSGETGSEEISGISLSMSGLSNELLLGENAFARLRNLKFLRFYTRRCKDEVKLRACGSLSYLSHKLRLIEWYGYPMKAMPRDFRPRCLVSLDMQNSKLEMLWEGTQPLGNLEVMVLRGSKSLGRISDLSDATKLRSLVLSGCSSLVRVPDLSKTENLSQIITSGCTNLVSLPCLSNSPKLRFISSSHCTNLEALPDLSNARNLQRLLIRNCTKLRALPDLSNATRLRCIDASHCPNLESLPCDRFSLKSLLLLNLNGCSKLKHFPEISRSITTLQMSGSAVEEVPPSIREWTRLIRVDMERCANLETFPHFPSTVKFLNLSGTGIREVPPWIEDLSRLKNLRMDRCLNLQTVAPNISTLEHLEVTSFSGCKSVASFPAEIFHSSRFSPHFKLDLRGVRHRSLPTCLHEKASTFLTRLCLSDSDIVSIPEYIKNLTQLQFLRLDNCTNLVSLPELPDSLHSLHAANCDSLERISRSLIKGSRAVDFTNCLRLNHEARDLIMKSEFGLMILPGKAIPINSDLQASGSSQTIALDLMHTPRSFRFKGCAILAAETVIRKRVSLRATIRCGCGEFHWDVDKRPPPGLYDVGEVSLKEEHVVFASDMFAFNGSDVDVAEMRDNELVFEFSCGDSDITRCGIEFLELHDK